MALRDILVHVDEGTDVSQQVAIELAANHKAHLLGLHIVSKVEFPGYPGVRIPEESVTRKRADEAEQRVAALREDFVSRADSKCEVTFEAVLDSGVQSLVDAARFVDLVVVAKADERRLGGMPLIDNGQLISNCSRPVLIVPRSSAGGEIGRSVMIGWNGGPKSVRAVNEALPLLKRARRVSIVAIDPPKQDRSMQGIREHLARHGIEADVHRIVGKGGEAGNTLVSVATDLGADLVVMGAYSRGGVREMLSAGTTRTLLHAMTTPVLMTY